MQSRKSSGSHRIQATAQKHDPSHARSSPVSFKQSGGMQRREWQQKDMRQTKQEKKKKNIKKKKGVREADSLVTLRLLLQSGC